MSTNSELTTYGYAINLNKKSIILPDKRLQESDVISRAYTYYLDYNPEELVTFNDLTLRKKENFLSLSYKTFPYISLILHSGFLVSTLLLALNVFFHISTIHPIILVWSMVASGGMARVVLTASKEFRDHEI